MDPTTGALGYGIEYGYSVMERLRLAALGVTVMGAEWLLVNHLPGPPIAIAAAVIVIGALAFWGLAWAVSAPEHRDMLRGLLLRRFRGGKGTA